MRNSSGFTILELSVVIAIVAILSAIAIPNYISWLPKHRLQSSALAVQAAINLAKMTAIKENTDVILTFDPANESYLAFIDTNEDGSQDAGERTVRNKGMSPGIDLKETTIPGNQLTFDSRGLADVSMNITLENKSAEIRTISVTITGISRIDY